MWRPPLWRFIRRQIPPANFITLHYLYFIVTCLLSSVIFWGASTPPRSVSYINSLFLTISAMTGAGLNTVNLSTLNTFQQFLLFLLLMLGSAIFVSAFVVQLRRASFERKFKAVIATRDRRGRSRGRSRMWSLNRQSKASGRGDAAGLDEEATLGEIEVLSVSPAQCRHLTPPARCGGVEMNSSPHGMEKRMGLANGAATWSAHELSPDLVPNVSHTITFSPETHSAHHSQPLHSPIRRQRRRMSIFAMQGVGAHPTSGFHMDADGDLPVVDLDLPPRSTLPESDSNKSDTKPDIGRYFESVGGWISRNSQFHGLTAKEREQLGGYEYRAVSLLAWVVPVYFVLWQLLGCLGCAAWVAYHRPNVAMENGLNPWWTGAFNAVSAFNNSGMSLLDANMTAFQNGYYLLITMGLLILAGNTCYPVFLRLIIWVMHQLASRFRQRSKRLDEYASTLKFLLDHPRRCYTNLFPSQHTWWLLLSVVTLNGIDWAAFEILNIGNAYLDAELSSNERAIDGLFQAVAVRSGGFYVVNIPNLRISLLVLYVVMMYISVYPVVITMRNSNVYEERSLGIYSEDYHDQMLSTIRPDTREITHRPQPQQAEQQLSGTSSHNRPLLTSLNKFLTALNITTKNESPPHGLLESNSQFIRAQLRAQLAHDLWWVALALFLILIIEGSQFDADPVNFSVFNFIFEIVSAYGCVGISVGVPNENYSFSGSWHTLSKLILCAVMLRGRHRGLPVAIDKAVLLPGEENTRAEELDGWLRSPRSRTRTRARSE